MRAPGYRQIDLAALNRCGDERTQQAARPDRSGQNRARSLDRRALAHMVDFVTQLTLLRVFRTLRSA
jgi:hypothetical protein